MDVLQLATFELIINLKTAQVPGLTVSQSLVMAAAGDPVRSGLVANLARSGGNLTGNSILEADLALKRLELVKEIVRTASRLRLFHAPGTQIGAAAGVAARTVEHAAGSLAMLLLRADEVIQ